MALEIPRSEDIERKIFLDAVTNLNQSQSACSVSILNALAKSTGNQIWAAYVCQSTLGYTPLDATGRKLDAFGEICGISRLKATYALGFVTVNGSGNLPEGTTLTRCDGIRYEVVEDTDTPSDQIPVIAIEPGSSGNVQSGVSLTIDTAIAGLSTNTVVSTNGIAGGSDDETEEAFRSRVIACTSNPCRTGTKSDYEFWTYQYNGVTDVQIIGCPNGPGTVKICFAMQENYLNGIPLGQDVVNLQEIIDENQPLGIKATVCAATPVNIDVSIRLFGEKTIQVRNQIIAGLVDLFKLAKIGNFCLSDIYSSINQTYDECFEIVIPDKSFNLGDCELPTLGIVNFVT